MHDFQYISSIQESGQHFVSVAYCRSVERLCCATRTGILFFYTLNDNDNESGDDEMLEMLDEEQQQQMKMNTNIIMTKNNNNNNNTIMDGGEEATVTDGGGGGCGLGAQSTSPSSSLSDDPVACNPSPQKCLEASSKGNNNTNDNNNKRRSPVVSVSKVNNNDQGNEEISMNGPNSDHHQQPASSSLSVSMSSSISTSSSTATSNATKSTNTSSSSNSSSTNTNTNNTNAINLLAYRGGGGELLQMSELQAMHSLTQFDENLVMYGAEVPSSWTDLVQAQQKQRKQTQNMRGGVGEDTQFCKTWRLRNDT